MCSILFAAVLGGLTTLTTIAASLHPVKVHRMLSRRTWLFFMPTTIGISVTGTIVALTMAIGATG